MGDYDVVSVFLFQSRCHVLEICETEFVPLIRMMQKY